MSTKTSVSKTVWLIVATVPFVVPFLFLISTAVKSVEDYQKDPIGLPENPSLANLKDAWSEASLGSAMLNSWFIVGLAVLLTLILSSAAGFWFLDHTGRTARTLWVALLATMVVPAPVFIIPLFVNLSNVGVVSNRAMLALTYAAVNSAFGMYLMKAYFDGLPREIRESARVDGATHWQQFWHLILPLSKPALATLAALSFLWSWSDLLLAVVLIQDPVKRPLTAAVALLSDQYSTNTPKLAAGVLIAILPVIVVFLFAQRFLAKGVAAGVGK